MTLTVHHDKTTDVAFIDICEAPKGTRIRVVDVSEDLDFKSQILARMDDDGNLFGIIIENYGPFKSEVRRKYTALAVEAIIELIVSKLKSAISHAGHSINGSALATA